MNNLCTLLVDDEILNRSELRALLEPYEKIGEIFEAENSREAMDILRYEKIDLVFLDIEMEEKNAGLLLAKQITRLFSPPVIIFVTAHEEYSLESYNYAPLHYLLKPINDDKFDEALQRAFQWKLSDNCRLAIKYRKEEGQGVSYPTTYIESGDILYIHKSKLGNTIEIYLHNGDILEGVRQTLDQFLKKLNKKYFFRIHISFIVNLAQVKELKQRVPNDENYCLIVNNSTVSLPISKSNLEEVRYLLSTI